MLSVALYLSSSENRCVCHAQLRFTSEYHNNCKLQLQYHCGSCLTCSHLHVQVYGLPTLVVFKDGKLLDGSQREGAISEPELRKYLDKWEVV